MKQSWFITGASSGLGRLMTERLLARGNRVVATARRTDTLRAVQELHGERLHVAALDVADPAAVRAVIDGAFSRGRIDVIVNNAGYGLFGAAEELTGDQIEHQLATNLLGSIHVIRAALPHLRQQGGGRIVQVSSEGGQIAYPSFSLYHATKWGIEGFIESVSQEVAPFGVDFVIVEPGPTGTSFGANLVRATPLGAYDATPAGELRRAVDAGHFVVRGDAEKTVDAMIAAADSAVPPLRLTLGGTAFESISSALRRRLAALEAQRELAYSVDRADP
ncbi:MAG TPA: SDR family oxidoreductase [Polyangiaceae bacterium]|nr:SDR family oxidoreductase [Polyangiaceae bacterium]